MFLLMNKIDKKLENILLFLTPFVAKIDDPLHLMHFSKNIKTSWFPEIRIWYIKLNTAIVSIV